MMAINPQMLAQILQSQRQPQSVGGMQGQSALGGAGQLLQKLAMMRNMQQQMRPPQQPQSPMSGMPIQGQGAPGGIAPDQPVDPTMNFRRLIGGGPPQGSVA
jgi:hypothetical protein